MLEFTRDENVATMATMDRACDLRASILDYFLKEDA